MKVAEIVLGGKYKHEDFMEVNSFEKGYILSILNTYVQFRLFTWQDDDESLDFTLKADEEDSIDFQEPIMDSLKEVKNLENI